MKVAQAGQERGEFTQMTFVNNYTRGKNHVSVLSFNSVQKASQIRRVAAQYSVCSHGGDKFVKFNWLEWRLMVKVTFIIFVYLKILDLLKT